jgi:HAD superfamily hydrolase (TIGR01549 family)
MSLKAVAFDVDGTLYPNRRFYIRVAPFTIGHLRVMIALGKVRKELREIAIEPGIESFYRQQARLIARELNLDPSTAGQFLETRIYRGWEPIFKKVKPYAHLGEVLGDFHRLGLKLGILSDFPPQAKLGNLGLSGLWDAVVCSEEVGRLKPAKEPFDALLRALGTEPGETLYVGNSYRYDVKGAKAAGLRTAMVAPAWKRAREADFVFRDYRELRKYVLNDLQ